MQQVVYTARQVQKTYSGTPGYPKPPDADTLGHSMVGYSCSLVSARYVDTVGAQHTVPVLDMDGAIVDPLGIPWILLCTQPSAHYNGVGAGREGEREGRRERKR